MRKIILPLIVCLALVASIGAVSYSAQVYNRTDVNVDHTWNAELALKPVDFSDTSISGDFVIDYEAAPGGGAWVVRFEFGNVQPNSYYAYNDVLEIKNNKPYAVKVYAQILNDSYPGELKLYDLVQPGKANPNIYIGTTKVLDNANLSGILPGATLAAGETKLVDFSLFTGSLAPAGSYAGTVRFVGYAP